MYVLYSVGTKYNWLNQKFFVFKTLAQAREEQRYKRELSWRDYEAERGPHTQAYEDDPETTEYHIVEVTAEMLQRIFDEIHELNTLTDIRMFLNEYI